MAMKGAKAFAAMIGVSPRSPRQHSPDTVEAEEILERLKEQLLDLIEKTKCAAQQADSRLQEREDHEAGAKLPGEPLPATPRQPEPLSGVSGGVGELEGADYLDPDSLGNACAVDYGYGPLPPMYPVYSQEGDAQYVGMPSMSGDPRFPMGSMYSPLAQGVSAVDFGNAQFDREPSRAPRVTSSGSQDLPANIYGACMMAAIRSTQGFHNIDGTKKSIYVGLLFTYFVLFYILYFFHSHICSPGKQSMRAQFGEVFDELDDRLVFSNEKWAMHDDDNTHTVWCQLPVAQPMFTMLILLIWSCSCAAEVRDSLGWMQLWYELPSSSDWVTGTRPRDDDKAELLSTSRRTRCFVILVILLPKLVASLYLFWLGIMFLGSTTSFSDLTMNCVGLAFLSELDELLYSFIITQEVKDMVNLYVVPILAVRRDLGFEERQMQSTTKGNNQRHTLYMSTDTCSQITILFQIIMTVVIPTLMWNWHFPFQPFFGYPWDLHEACKEKFHNEWTLRWY